MSSPELLRDAPRDQLTCSPLDDSSAHICFKPSASSSGLGLELDDDAPSGSDTSLQMQTRRSTGVAATPTPADASSGQLGVSVGSPGHTPFPHPRPGSDCEIGASACGSSSSSSQSHVPGGFFNSSPLLPPPVPFNTPEDPGNDKDDALLRQLKHEAAKYEQDLKRSLEEKSLLDKFQTPVSRGLVKRRRQRLLSGLEENADKKTKDDEDENSVADDNGHLASDLLPDRDGLICEHVAPAAAVPNSSSAVPAVPDGAGPSPKSAVNRKEMARRVRVNASVDVLKELVPGMDAASDKAEVYDATAKYLLYLKQKVGPKYDKDFLEEFLLY